MAKVWHYRDKNGVDVIKQWASEVPKRQLIKLQLKIDSLIKNGSELSPHLLSDTGQPGIKKIKVQGNPKLRPLLCKIFEADAEKEEWVILVGTYEKGWKYVPKDALIDAAIRRKEVLENEKRRTPHVRLTNGN
jgi:hypothetical protein